MGILNTFFGKLFKKKSYQDSLLKEIFRGKKPSNETETVQAYIEGYARVKSEHSYHFWWNVDIPSTGEDEFNEKVNTAIEPIRLKYIDSIISEWGWGFGNGALSFGAICFDDNEVKNIENDIESALNKLNATYEQLGPERCKKCSMIIQDWPLIPAPKELEEKYDQVLGCPRCHTPKDDN